MLKVTHLWENELHGPLLATMMRQGLRVAAVTIETKIITA
jgi:hypothetical protein